MLFLLIFGLFSFAISAFNGFGYYTDTKTEDVFEYKWESSDTKNRLAFSYKSANSPSWAICEKSAILDSCRNGIYTESCFTNCSKASNNSLVLSKNIYNSKSKGGVAVFGFSKVLNNTVFYIFYKGLSATNSVYFIDGTRITTLDDMTSQNYLLPNRHLSYFAPTFIGSRTADVKISFASSDSSLFRVYNLFGEPVQNIEVSNSTITITGVNSYDFFIIDTFNPLGSEVISVDNGLTIANFASLKNRKLYQLENYVSAELSVSYYYITIKPEDFTSDDKSVEAVVIPKNPSEYFCSFQVDYVFIAESENKTFFTRADNNDGVLAIDSDTVTQNMANGRNVLMLKVYPMIDYARGPHLKSFNITYEISVGALLNINTIGGQEIGVVNSFQNSLPTLASSGSYGMEFMLYYFSESSKVRYDNESISNNDLIPLSAATFSTPKSGYNSADHIMFKILADKYKIISLQEYGETVVETQTHDYEDVITASFAVKTFMNTNSYDTFLFYTAAPLFCNVFLLSDSQSTNDNVRDVSVIADTVWPIFDEFFKYPVKYNLINFKSSNDDDFFAYLHLDKAYISEDISSKKTYVELSLVDCNVNFKISVFYSFDNPLPNEKYCDGSFQNLETKKFGNIRIPINYDRRAGDILYVSFYADKENMGNINLAVSPYIEEIKKPLSTGAIIGILLACEVVVIVVVVLAWYFGCYRKKHRKTTIRSSIELTSAENSAQVNIV